MDSRVTRTQPRRLPFRSLRGADSEGVNPPRVSRRTLHAKYGLLSQSLQAPWSEVFAVASRGRPSGGLILCTQTTLGGRDPPFLSRMKGRTGSDGTGRPTW